MTQVGDESVDHLIDEQSVASEDEINDEDDQSPRINLNMLPNDHEFYTKLLLESSPLIKRCFGRLAEESTKITSISKFVSQDLHIIVLPL